MASINPLAFIEKLTGRDNYNTWKFAVKSYLEHEDLWECIDPGAKNAQKDVKAKSKIILLIDPVNYIHVQEARTAREVWLNLQRAFDDSGLSRKVGLLKDLITTSLDSCSNVEEYVNKVMSTAHKLRNIGFAVDDEWLGTLLLAGLPDTYKPMIMAIESSGVSISADFVKTKILQDVKSSDSAAFYTNYNKRNVHKFIRNKGHGKGPRCYTCNEYGHKSTNCTSSKKKESKSKSNNSNSGFVAAFSAFSVSVDNCWVIDSGASVHMTNREDWLYDRKTATVATIKMADSKSLQVKGCGNLNLQIPGSGNNTQVIQFI
ncbi:uncharacterized protein LOC123876704 [Maniola jurtina]|uniref:uncharacterized protein LOC123876704 n=1 Tax=Maniola jurtina TaxID=191418 RepID=UPI001E6867B7|nr:uncharacterized protein LOC123876704 [Maniola jurtina]